jgi:hypothetical protein
MTRIGHRRLGWLWFAVALALLSGGCLGRRDTVRVTGQLMKDGKPYVANLAGKEPETFAIDFVGKVKDTPVIYPASMSADGSFRVDGSDGGGIPRGQYKIAVLHSGFQGAGGDRLGARYSAEKTPLTVDLNENARLTIDVGAGTVTK